MHTEPTPIDLAGSARQLRADAEAAHARARAAGHIYEQGTSSDLDDPLRARRRGRWEALVPAVLGDPRIDDLAPPIARELASWADSILAGGRTALILTGPVGTGKSHAAYAALRPLVGADRTVIGGHVGALLDELRPDLAARTSTAAMRRLVTADVLLLDDLGDERPTDWTVERLGLLIHQRHADLRPLVITTNMPGDALAGHLEPHIGERACSRLADDHLVLRLTGADLRRAPR